MKLDFQFLKTETKITLFGFIEFLEIFFYKNSTIQMGLNCLLICVSF
jgi:hypothetical protein